MKGPHKQIHLGMEEPIELMNGGGQNSGGGSSNGLGGVSDIDNKAKFEKFMHDLLMDPGSGENLIHEAPKQEVKEKAPQDRQAASSQS